jgi:hypothetical protein
MLRWTLPQYLLQQPTVVRKLFEFNRSIQGNFESCADILITSYWLHVEPLPPKEQGLSALTYSSRDTLLVVITQSQSPRSESAFYLNFHR